MNVINSNLVLGNYQSTLLFVNTYGNFCKKKKLTYVSSSRAPKTRRAQE